MDNGEVINSTEDHRFLMRDGEYKKAEELEVGDSMMPGYFTTGDFGRLAIKNNFSLNSPCIYKLASLYNIQHGIYQYDPEKIYHIILIRILIIIIQIILLIYLVKNIVKYT